MGNHPHTAALPVRDRSQELCHPWMKTGRFEQTGSITPVVQKAWGDCVGLGHMFTSVFPTTFGVYGVVWGDSSTVITNNKTNQPKHKQMTPNPTNKTPQNQTKCSCLCRCQTRAGQRWRWHKGASPGSPHLRTAHR